MMGRDDIPVGVGGEGGILPNATILPNVGGYLPIIDQVCLISFFFFLYSCLILVVEKNENSFEKQFLKIVF